MRKFSGFTLMELMVVIAIIAILAAIAIPNFIAWLPEFRLRSAADEIQSMICRARMYAVKENTRAVVLFDPDRDGNLDGNYLAFVDDMAGGSSDWTREPVTELLIASGSVPAGISISSTQFRNHRFRFNSRGLLMDVNKRIVLKNSHKKIKNIQLYVSGISKVR